MNILLSETEENLLMLLEELTKHQDWIQDSSLSENLNPLISIVKKINKGNKSSWKIFLMLSKGVLPLTFKVFESSYLSSFP